MVCVSFSLSDSVSPQPPSWSPPLCLWSMDGRKSCLSRISKSKDWKKKIGYPVTSSHSSRAWSRETAWIQVPEIKGGWGHEFVHRRGRPWSSSGFLSFSQACRGSIHRTMNWNWRRYRACRCRMCLALHFGLLQVDPFTSFIFYKKCQCFLSCAEGHSLQIRGTQDNHISWPVVFCVTILSFDFVYPTTTLQSPVLAPSSISKRYG